MTKTISETINIGDAGYPCEVQIEVEYIDNGDSVTVTDWQEIEGPYDNPPQVWYRIVEDLIEESFNKKVKFN